MKNLCPNRSYAKKSQLLCLYNGQRERSLYIGVSNDLVRRAEEHRQDLIEGFTKKYKCHKLVYYEHFTNINDAIRREKELKGWKRFRKVNLLVSTNKSWKDLRGDIAN